MLFSVVLWFWMFFHAFHYLSNAFSKACSMLFYAFQSVVIALSMLLPCCSIDFQCFSMLVSKACSMTCCVCSVFVLFVFDVVYSFSVLCIAFQWFVMLFECVSLLFRCFVYASRCFVRYFVYVSSILTNCLFNVFLCFSMVLNAFLSFSTLCQCVVQAFSMLVYAFQSFFDACCMLLQCFSILV